MASSRRQSHNFDYSFKILVLGDIGVGKSKLAERFCEGQYNPAYRSTLGVDFTEKLVELDNVRIRLQIWDTAGQERYRTLTSSFYRGAMGVLLLYDITAIPSFRNVASWITNIREYSFSDISIVLVGSKCDLDAGLRTVDHRSAHDLAHEYDLPHFTTSAKTGENVDDVFLKLCRLMLHAKYKRRQSVSDARLIVKPNEEERTCPVCRIL